ncbi:uncharacterized protein LOC115537254 isoform X3 [Gadus morhua]|uniref:uncharacterized protein LOC115537254 isoform X3 n=1 Tax=Gadus morhua TaxID=8049 RepID=UPI0011B46C13|nr:uncharacterized protein LOC115537254 isoform X3 [Gadus morhua]
MTTCGIVTKSLLLLAVVVALIGQGSAVPKFSECCTRVSRQQITETIVDYTVQKRNNHCVNAIIFQTESGSLYCCKHDESWVKGKVRQLMMRQSSIGLRPLPPYHLPPLLQEPGRKKISIGLRHCLPVAHHLQLLSSTIGVNQRHALNALYRPIEMHLIQRRPTSSKMADQILLKRKTMSC